MGMFGQNLLWHVNYLHKINLYRLFYYLVLFGNLIFILWITYNGIDEGFKGTIYQKLSYVGLVILLSLNAVLLYRKNRF